MNIPFNQIFQSSYFWSFAGGGLAIVFVLLQKRSMAHISTEDAQKILSNTLGQSAIRVLISVAVLFLAFKTGLKNGLVCLITYILIRWIWIIMYIWNIKKEKVKD